jgi:hypothetical protein
MASYDLRFIWHSQWLDSHLICFKSLFEVVVWFAWLTNEMWLAPDYVFRSVQQFRYMMQSEGISTGIPVRKPVRNDSEFMRPFNRFIQSHIHWSIEKNNIDSPLFAPWNVVWVLPCHHVFLRSPMVIFVPQVARNAISRDKKQIICS